MQLKADYFKNLEKYGVIPDSNLSIKFKMMESLTKYKQAKQEMFPDKFKRNITYKAREIQDLQKSMT